ncbi:DNA topoisomerase 2, putative [Babesia ovata]|uniref:DNA topoisomerase 2, putative n=1 Tax=Babesia ovata TaxID=189622 RepID=A0A2H6K824_9APIC|nr:DNA topoisomerase 2, putative [Babesia ovata]GBE59146.1 DNA topoisomerase 2, putative [Babesia ovata]
MESWKSKIDAGGAVFRKLTGQFKAAIDEVGVQLKRHASQATKEIGIDLENLQPPFCKGLNQVQCSLFSAPGSCANKRTTVTVSGEFDFGFNVKFHPHEIGVVIATVSGVNELDCTFKWKRRHASYEVDIEHTDGPRYSLTADDIGTSLIIHCTHSGGLGTAIGEIGPFDVDVASRRAIQDALINSTARHDLFLERDATSVKCLCDVLKIPAHAMKTDGSSVKYAMYIMAEEVQLQPDDDIKGDGILKCKYSSSFPRLRLCTEDPLKLFLRISEKHELTLRAFSKQQRDMVALMLRAFHSRQLILNTLEANSLEVMRDGKLQDPTEGGKRLDVVLALQKANDDLSIMLEETARTRRELSRCKHEKSFLESEIENTIKVFQQQLSSDDAEASQTGQQKESYNETLYTELINRNAQLADQLSEITKERNAMEEEVDTLRGERNRLERHSQSVVKDLEKLRFDNQCLLKQIEELKAKIRKLAAS